MLQFLEIDVIKKEAEKVLKYKDPTEIQHMWNVKAKVIPLINGATGTISKSLGQYLSHIPGKHKIKEVGGKKKPYWALHKYSESTKHILCAK
jgi:hypothetical protein